MLFEVFLNFNHGHFARLQSSVFPQKGQNFHLFFSWLERQDTSVDLSSFSCHLHIFFVSILISKNPSSILLIKKSISSISISRNMSLLLFKISFLTFKIFNRVCLSSMFHLIYFLTAVWAIWRIFAKPKI